MKTPWFNELGFPYLYLNLALEFYLKKSFILNE